MTKENIGSDPRRRPYLDGLAALVWGNKDFRFFLKSEVAKIFRERTESQSEEDKILLQEWTERQYKEAQREQDESRKLHERWEYFEVQVDKINWSDKEEIDTSAKKFNSRTSSKIVSLLMKGIIVDLDDLSRLPDSYFLGMRDVGELRLSAIRRKFPYNPQK